MTIALVKFSNETLSNKSRLKISDAPALMLCRLHNSLLDDQSF